MILDENLFTEYVELGTVRGPYKKKELSDQALFNKIFDKLQAKLISKHYKVGTDSDYLFVNARVVSKKSPDGKVTISREFLNDEKDYEDIISYLDEANIKHEFRKDFQGLKLFILLNKDNVKDVNQEVLNRNTRVKKDMRESLSKEDVRDLNLDDTVATFLDGQDTHRIIKASNGKYFNDYSLIPTNNYGIFAPSSIAGPYESEEEARKYMAKHRPSAKEKVTEELSKEEVESGKDRWVKTEEDEKVWNSLSDEDKEFLVLSNDMGFWFDEIKGNEELEDRYQELKNKFSISLTEGFAIIRTIEDAQREVDEQIEKFGRIGGGLYDDLDDAGFYVDENNKVQYKVKPENESFRENKIGIASSDDHGIQIPNLINKKIRLKNGDIATVSEVDPKSNIVIYKLKDGSQSFMHVFDLVECELVESLKEDLNTFDYDKLQKELEAIPNVTKVDFDKDLIYDTKELIVLVNWHSDSDTAQWFRDKVAVKTKAIEVFKNNGLKLSDPVEDNGDYYYFVLREITPKAESLKEEHSEEKEIKLDRKSALEVFEDLEDNPDWYNNHYNAEFKLNDNELIIKAEEDKLKEIIKDYHLEDYNIKIEENLKEELAPEQEKEYGLGTFVNDLIKSEFDAINDYNSAIVTFEAEGKGEFTDIIRDIISEEHKHVGQLQTILKELNPSTVADIDEGQQEGQEQIDQAAGVTKGDTEETTTTIDTEDGVIKTYKLDNIEKMEEK